jgi:ribosomal protein S27E
MLDYEEGGWPDEKAAELMQALIDNGTAFSRYAGTFYEDEARRFIREGRCRQTVVASTNVKVHCPRCGDYETVTERTATEIALACGHRDRVGP